MSSQSFLADPQSNLDYEWDWSAWLADGETIISHTVTPDTGITVVSHTATTTTVTVWLTGGTVRTRYNVACHIVTSAGRADDRTLTITVQDR